MKSINQATFYVYEIRDGWARVYSPSNDGYVWYERLIVKDVYKTAGGKSLRRKLISNR